jgi:hypothetical protein
VPTDVLAGVCGEIGVAGLLTSWCLALGHKRCLWELRVSVPWHPLCALSWHNRWRGYPRKAGHPTLSTTSRHDLIALPRSRQVFDLR